MGAPWRSPPCARVGARPGPRPSPYPCLSAIGWLRNSKSRKPQLPIPPVKPQNAEPRAKETDLRARQDELSSATAERDAARASFEGLRKARLDGFMAGARAARREPRALGWIGC